MIVTGLLPTYQNALRCLGRPRCKLIHKAIGRGNDRLNLVLTRYIVAVALEVEAGVRTTEEVITFYFELGIIVNRLIIAAIHTTAGGAL